MFMHLKNVPLFTSASLIVLIQLFCTFGTLNGFELPLELLQEGVNAAKSMDYARRMAFPLSAGDNGVELPPTIEDSMDLNAPNGFGPAAMEDNDDDDDLDDAVVPMKSEMPKWLQMQLQPEPQQHNNNNNYQQQQQQLLSTMLPKHKQSNKHQHHHHHDSRQVHAASSPLRRCSIEISSKIPGICQTMGSIGSACVSGDYIDVFNAECL
ncbi:uncharacterized protein LOC135955756 [Calliphora vicina]|uniref:uncharacterized protein LOC135955756 n=1 Tax=Calliphora vicina TaxID=7373 RepID=UPI00325A6784